jgi:signal transduction histidine kinase
VALRWRIRHKLLLGLAVVASIIGLLLTGTLLGLAAFNSTFKITDSKLIELHDVETLKGAIRGLRPDPNVVHDWTEEDQKRVGEQIDKVRLALTTFSAHYQETIDRGYGVDRGRHGQTVVGDIQAKLDAFAQEIAKGPPPTLFRLPEPPTAVSDDYHLRDKVNDLMARAESLRESVYTDIYERFRAARREHRHSLIIVITTSVLGVLLMAGLLRFFYTWVFHPIRDLQQGVNRVARGDFSQPIVLNSQDEMEELAAAFNDMTSRLHATYRELAQQVNERGKQLVRSERLASLGYLAAGVAHEINNPLASIAFCAEGLERRLSDLLSRVPREQETIVKYLKMIQEEAFRCKHITQGLLEFSRVGEGERQPTDLVEVVQSVLDMVQHLRNCQGKRIVFRPAIQPMALANKQEIKQVVLNIVVNALDSMGDDGELTIDLDENGPSAEMVFSDTGCGMTPEILDKIFEPFFTAKSSGKGTGLGLSISQRIVSQHGGEIEASSPGPGHGSTFVVRLPLPTRRADAPTLAKEVAIGHAAAA